MLSEDPPVVACHKHDNKLVCSHPLKGTHNDLKGYGPGFVDAETLRGTDWMATHAEIRDAECTGRRRCWSAKGGVKSQYWIACSSLVS